MNENLDLCEILRDCPKNTPLFSTVFGEVKLVKVYSLGGIKCEYIDKYSHCPNEIFFRFDGLLYDVNGGECVLFPSKDQRDWSKFTPSFKDLEKDTIVFIRNKVRVSWCVGRYAGNQTAFEGCFEKPGEYEYIIPYTPKMDMKTIARCGMPDGAINYGTAGKEGE